MINEHCTLVNDQCTNKLGRTIPAPNIAKKQVVMKKIRLILMGVLVLGAVSGWGQEPIPLTAKEIDSLKNLAEYNQAWNQFLNVWAILGPILGALTTLLLLKSRIQKWAEDEITNKANEKFAVDWAVVKQLVDDKKRDTAIKIKRLAIVNKQTGRRQDLVTMLEKYGFKNPPPQFFKLADFNTKFDHNQFDLVILDNHDSQLSEAEMRQIIGAHQFPYVLFTVEQTSKAFFDEYKGKVKFAQIEQNIPDYIAQSF